MPTISLRVNPYEERLIREYARRNHLTLSRVLRSAAIDRIEDEFDLALFDKVLAKMKSRNGMAEVKKSLGLA